MPKRTKEGEHGNRLHKALKICFKGHIYGHKIHGSPYQKKGIPDYVYVTGSNVFGQSAFWGIEHKYYYTRDVRKTIPVRLESKLDSNQYEYLRQIHLLGGIAMQASFIEYESRKRLLVISLPHRGPNVVGPNYEDIETKSPEQMRDTLKLILRPTTKYPFYDLNKLEWITGLPYV